MKRATLVIYLLILRKEVSHRTAITKIAMPGGGRGKFVVPLMLIRLLCIYRRFS
jgi:hypothetical protein